MVSPPAGHLFEQSQHLLAGLVVATVTVIVRGQSG